MTATAHALVAGAIATKIHDPFLAATLSLTTHFIMDSIPHWDFGTNWRNRPKAVTGALAIAETLFGIGVSLYFFSTVAPLSTLVIAILFSLLPDWLEAPWYIFYAKTNTHGLKKRAGVMERFFYAFYKIPNIFHAKATFPLGVITQVVTVLFFLVVLG